MGHVKRTSKGEVIKREREREREREFNIGAKAAEAASNICTAYEDNAIGESTTRKWFSRFKKDRFDISNTPRSGKSSGFDQDRLNTLIHMSVLENWKM